MSLSIEHSAAARDPDARSGAERAERAPPAAEPRVVTRGETHTRDDQSPSATAFVDWLAFTVKLPPGQGLTWLLDALVLTFCVPREDWTAKGRGWMGYTHRIDLGDFGLVAYGGEAQRDTYHVELNAHSCARIADWSAVKLWGEVYQAVITRVDCAHDDFTGNVVALPRALQWFRDGAFNANGRPPCAHLRDDLGSGKGKTLYVGARESGKLLRVYEKGRELGDPESPWVRAEVELRNKGRVVPWETVTAPGRYLAGAYPALRVLSAEQSRIRTIRRSVEIGYDAMVRNLRTQGGKALNVMLAVNEGDAMVVVSEVVREGVPGRLVPISDKVREVVAALRGPGENS